jgi:hypothetical protein
LLTPAKRHICPFTKHGVSNAVNVDSKCSENLKKVKILGQIRQKQGFFGRDLQDFPALAPTLTTKLTHVLSEAEQKEHEVLTRSDYHLSWWFSAPFVVPVSYLVKKSIFV